MIRSISLLGVMFCLLCLLVCSGCDQKTGETAAAGRATPPPDSPAAKFLKNSAAGRPASRPPGGFQK